MFVKTDCTSNERLLEGQDSRYSSSYFPEDDYHGEVSLSVSLSITSYLSDAIFQAQDPKGDETCYRACLCGYTEAYKFENVVPAAAPSAPYQVCDCIQILGTYLSRRDFEPVGGDLIFYMTSANITLFQYYGIMPCDAEVGSSGDLLKNSYFNSDPAIRWAGVPDNDSEMVSVFRSDDGRPAEDTSIADLVIKNDYECFGSFENISSVIFDYYRYSVEDDLLPPPSLGYCDPN